MAIIGTDTNHAAEVLDTGGLVGIPTETVYGLAANAFNEEAIVKVYKAKNRPAFDPLITHIANQEALQPLVKHVPVKAKQLMDKFWPGPLTLVLAKSDKINDLISSGLSTAAFRMPRHKLLHELLEKLNFPIVAPSANPFGYVSPTTAKHVNLQLGEKIDYILDGGSSKIGIESTIISFEQDDPIILRLGGLSVEEIEAAVGKVNISISSSSKPSAPGMLISHYSPTKSVLLGNIDELIKKHQKDKIGVLSYHKKYPSYPNFVLSEKASLDEAAKNLFSGLRWFETQDIDLVLTENVPNEGLGKAINDRLNRASIK
ncbi:MAG: threonylcarbamoyl-AMP synthase [Bacteroidetes bacterium]|nr:MAG: threonylcarbamoyl-AMP synthase [Bacteroidota bacterium]